LVRCLLPGIDTNPQFPLDTMARRLGLVDRHEQRLPMLPATDELEKRLDQVLVRAGWRSRDGYESMHTYEQP
jgi:4-hydroxy-tetrahydrodipicolinate synthase